MSAGMQAVQCRWHDTNRERPLLGQKRVSSAQVSRGLVWDRTGMLSARGRRLTDAPPRFILPVTELSFAACCGYCNTRYVSACNFTASLQFTTSVTIFVVSSWVPNATRCKLEWPRNTAMDAFWSVSRLNLRTAWCNTKNVHFPHRFPFLSQTRLLSQ